ncbi:hypothetical protein GCM10010277_11490 [Streptomyces longisporoflavus]|uniref:hypothetical protein n=1 Tax=Streptomyces longisporoflavus TaxID=28044 RepID=UPI00167EB49C|nr:hypothetical protein [Streptomyces longisporoflavus]GGV28976.1 hypothetical protein GCM10010277_11490 [Streptomyces longisporoflavus]
MAYDLQAVIADEALLRAASRELPEARPASIGQGLSLLPMTDTVFDSVTDGDASETPGFWRLPTGFARTLADWSTAGPVAYVEAEYFGGVGEQQAAVWDRGALVLGPLHEPEDQPFPPEGSAISQALRWLGVVAGDGEDEFTAAGLGRHRSVDHWIG